MSTVLARTVLELRGIPWLALEEVEPAKQQIIASRSFGRPVTTRQALNEAVAWHVSRAAVNVKVSLNIRPAPPVCTDHRLIPGPGHSVVSANVQGVKSPAACSMSIQADLM